MHSELFVGVAEAGGLAVPVADLEERCAGGGGEGGGDVAGGGGAVGGDGDAGGGGDEELVLVEGLAVGAGLHGGGAEGAVAGGGGPVLRGGVVPWLR